MLAEAREKYNREFSSENYNALLSSIKGEFPNRMDFRIAESPLFVTRAFKAKLLLAANSIIDFILKPDFKQITEEAVPENLRFNNEGKHPHFLAIDFAISPTETNELEPQLIELQGFPSLFAFQHYLAGKFKKFCQIDSSLTPYFNKLNTFSYQQTLADFFGVNPQKNTILLEVFPEAQKTRIDFDLTHAYWGIEAVCLSKIFKKENTLYYLKDKSEIKIDCIYNRIIFDEIEQKYPDLISQVKLLQDADVQWITNPNWFYRISKFCLPYLSGKSIPECHFLHKLGVLPDDLRQFVLKPLFSFAGSGVDLYPTAEKIEKIKDQDQYILQRKVQYAPFIKTTDGGQVKAEIRLLFIWPENALRPKLVTSLARFSRGEMIGVNQNISDTWVGGSAVFYEAN